MINYTWIISRHRNGRYNYKGFAYIGGEWRQHSGSAKGWISLKEVFEHIEKCEAEMSSSEDNESNRQLDELIVKYFDNKDKK